MPMQQRNALDEKRILKLFNDGMGAYLISQRFNCAYNTIRDVLRRHGIQQTRINHEKKKTHELS